MNLSLGEYRALVAKAFRGAGYSWGLTEEASYAARLLAEFDLSSGEVVVRLLNRADGADAKQLMPEADWKSAALWMCPVCVGTSIADLGGIGSASIGLVLEPILMAPFLRLALADSGFDAYLLTWDGGGCEITEEAIKPTGLQPIEPVEVTIVRQFQPPDADNASIRASRVELDDATVSELERFAQRVYAPATEASRLSGAGAGTTDND